MKTVSFFITALSAGLINISCEQMQPKNSMGNGAEVVKEDMVDGYRFTRYHPYATFSHNKITNTNTLFFNNQLFFDEGCDGLVDRIASLGHYKRGDSGTAEIFGYADSLLQAEKQSFDSYQ